MSDDILLENLGPKPYEDGWAELSYNATDGGAIALVIEGYDSFNERLWLSIEGAKRLHDALGKMIARHDPALRGK